MKKVITIIILITTCNALFSQAPTNTELSDFNRSRNKKTSKGLKILGGWALANLGTSAYYYYNTKGVDKSFHQMNMMWNGANTLIVVASLLPKEKNDMNLAKTLNWQSNTEATYVASAALDLLYSTTGLYLTERAKTDFGQHDKLEGWGNALIYNGGFLFLFDTSMFIIHKKNGKKLYKMMDKINVSTSGLGLRIGIHL